MKVKYYGIAYRVYPSMASYDFDDNLYTREEADKLVDSLNENAKEAGTFTFHKFLLCTRETNPDIIRLRK